MLRISDMVRYDNWRKVERKQSVKESGSGKDKKESFHETFDKSKKDDTKNKRV